MIRRLSLPVLIAMFLTSFSSPASAGEWKFPVGLTYSSGFGDVIDLHEDAVGVDSDFAFPIGVSFHPYIQLDKGHQVGIDVGPLGIILIDVIGGPQSGDYDYFQMPVGVTYGYTFLRDRSTSPYVRAGVHHILVSGDFADDSSPGAFAAFGVEFNRQRAVGFAFEVGYDGAKVEFPSLSREDVEVNEFNVSFRAVF